MRLSARIVGIAGVPIVGLVILAVVGWMGLGRINGDLRDIDRTQDEILDGVVWLDRAEIKAQRTVVSEKQLLSADDEERKPLELKHAAHLADVARTIAGVSQAAQDANLRIQDMSSAAKELSAVARELQGLVGRFRV